MTTRYKITALAVPFVVILAAIGMAFLYSRTNESSLKLDSRNRLHSIPMESRLLQASVAAQEPSRITNDAIPRSGAVRVRFLKLAKFDKYHAIDAALRLKGADRDLALAALATAWKADPRSGFKELADVIEKMTAYSRRQIVFGPAETAPRGKLPQDLIRSLNALSAFPDDPELPLLTMRLTNRLLGGEERSSVLTTAALACLGTDPSLAFSLGNSLSGFAYQQFINAFSKGWASQNPEAAAQWAASIGDPDLRTRALADAINSFSRSNPGRAAQWLDSLPAGDARQAALRELGTIWARQDTAAALAWAARLPDPAASQQAVTAIQSVAPVGVGISLGRANASGYPSAMDLVPASPAAQNGGVQRGDQIVAVTDPNNQWISTQNLPLNQVIAMIRGTAGAPVQLRLLPPGATDPAQARTVTIVRQQLLFKRTQSGG